MGRNRKIALVAEGALFFRRLQILRGGLCGPHGRTQKIGVGFDGVKGVGDVLERQDDGALVLRLRLVERGLGRALLVLQGAASKIGAEMSAPMPQKSFQALKSLLKLTPRCRRRH